MIDDPPNPYAAPIAEDESFGCPRCGYRRVVIERLREAVIFLVPLAYILLGAFATFLAESVVVHLYD